eukprot:gene5931-7383_t
MDTDFYSNNYSEINRQFQIEASKIIEIQNFYNDQHQYIKNILYENEVGKVQQHLDDPLKRFNQIIENELSKNYYDWNESVKSNFDSIHFFCMRINEINQLLLNDNNGQSSNELVSKLTQFFQDKNTHFIIPILNIQLSLSYLFQIISTSYQSNYHLIQQQHLSDSNPILDLLNNFNNSNNKRSSLPPPPPSRPGRSSSVVSPPTPSPNNINQNPNPNIFGVKVLPTLNNNNNNNLPNNDNFNNNSSPSQPPYGGAKLRPVQNRNSVNLTEMNQNKQVTQPPQPTNNFQKRPASVMLNSSPVINTQSQQPNNNTPSPSPFGAKLRPLPSSTPTPNSTQTTNSISLNKPTTQQSPPNPPNRPTPQPISNNTSSLPPKRLPPNPLQQQQQQLPSTPTPQPQQQEPLKPIPHLQKLPQLQTKSESKQTTTTATNSNNNNNSSNSSFKLFKSSFMNTLNISPNGGSIFKVNYANHDEVSKKQFHIVRKFKCSVESTYVENLKFTYAQVDGWSIIMPIPPSLSCQEIRNASFQIYDYDNQQFIQGSEAVQCGNQYLFRSIVEKNDKARTGVSCRYVIESDCYSVDLKETSSALNPGEEIIPYEPLSDEEYKIYTKDDFSYEYNHPEFVQYINEKGLARRTMPDGNLEHPITYAHRVATFVESNFTYSRTLVKPTQYIKTKTGDCGSTTVLIGSFLRYHGIPTRCQAGRRNVSESSKDGDPTHVKGEFFVENIGWIPYDGSGCLAQVSRYFGKDEGDMVLYHCGGFHDVDYLLLKGSHSYEFLQCCAFIFTCSKKYDYDLKRSRKWTVK